MEKLVYLIFQDEGLSGNSLRSGLIEKAVPLLQEAGAKGIRVNVHDEDVAAGKPQVEAGFRKGPPIRSMVSFWLDSADLREPCENALATHAAGFAGYLVVESCPLVHAVQPGKRTPGVNQVTCISRLPDLDYETFLQIWQEDHKEVAIRIQSTVGYVRNVVVRGLTDGAPAFDAIVEETFPIEAMTDPKVFYDYAESEETLEGRVAEMMSSCERFLDFEPMEMTFMSEYVLGAGREEG
jgi:hypothetical protein